jgi:hypothetical protein
MRPAPALTCPKCSAHVRVAPLGFPSQTEMTGEASGTILKLCPRCQVWSWMVPQTQEAS